MGWCALCPRVPSLISPQRGNQLSFSAQWELLRQQNVTTQGYRFAASTRSNVVSQIRQWIYFCVYFRLRTLPASAVDLSLFSELMSKTCGYGHIKNVIGGIRYLHHTTGHDFPTDSVWLEDTLQGLKRRLKGTPKQVLPIDPVILRRMFPFVNLESSSDIAMWVGCLLAFFTLFRKANLCPKDKNFDPETILTRDDVVLDESGQRVLVFVNFSKTNQFARRQYCIPIPRNDDPALDLYRYVELLYCKVKGKDDSPVLSYSSTGFIMHRTFTTKLKSWLTKAGLDPSLFSGHSFRRGGASYLYSIGGSTLMVQVMGDWRSQVFTRYLYLTMDDRQSAQSLICSAINKTVGYTTLPPEVLP